MEGWVEEEARTGRACVVINPLLLPLTAWVYRRHINAKARDGAGESVGAQALVWCAQRLSHLSKEGWWG